MSKVKQSMGSNKNHVGYKGAMNGATESAPKLTTGKRGPTTAGQTGQTAGYPTAHSYAHGRGGTVGARTGTNLYTPSGSQGAPKSRSADVDCALDQPVNLYTPKAGY
jgi:hypothetical protein